MPDIKQGCVTFKKVAEKCPKWREPHYQPDQARLWVLSSNLERSGFGVGGQQGGCTKGMR